MQKKGEKMVRINRHRMLELPEEDILIQAGDFTNNGTKDEVDSWLASLEFQHKITHLAQNVCRLAFHLCLHFLQIKRQNSKIQRLCVSSNFWVTACRSMMQMMDISSTV